jgi:DNA-directed RNA polymerase specialized sigma24 family protein
MHTIAEETPAEAWLQWFQTSRYRRCRAYLCATYGLEPADAEVLINTAALQVMTHWARLQTPLAYFWTILRRAVQQHWGAVTRDQRRRAAYARQQRVHAVLAASTAREVADLLAAVPPRQRQLLEWFVQGYADVQVAAHVGTTPHAVRQARYATYVALRHREAC